MLSSFFYIAYFILCFSSLHFIIVSKKKIYLLYPLIFTAQFNVTSFVKIGITISFFELNLIFATAGIIIIHSIKKTHLLDNIFFRKQDKVWILFIIFSFASILISIFRVNLGYLRPDAEFHPSYYIRSVMSLNKFFFYFPCFYIIRSYLLQYYGSEKIKVFFLKSMTFSGVLPVLAVFIQMSHIGFTLLHNNPSFGEATKIENYTGARPVGLTNEASFFVFQLFFSAIATYYAWKESIIRKKTFFLITTLYAIAVILSISRTGLIVFALFYAIIWLREIKVFTVAGFLKSLKFLPVIIIALAILAGLNVGGFNLGDRLLSSFSQGADLSTLERYGSTQALINLFLDKGLVFGVGIYNFQYYVKEYLPSFMSGFYYPKGVAPPSFNFILQIFVEFGLILAVAFFYKVNRYVFTKKNDRFYKDWFLFLLIFSFSFQTLNFAVPFLIFFYLQ